MKAINVGPTDEALAAWLAMDMGGEPMEGWLWDEEEKEWRPQMRDASDSSDEEGEAAFLERVARARHRQCDKESYEGLGKVAPQPTKQSGLGVGAGAGAGVAGRVRERCGRGRPHSVAPGRLARVWGVVGPCAAQRPLPKND